MSIPLSFCKNLCFHIALWVFFYDLSVSLSLTEYTWSLYSMFLWLPKAGLNHTESKAEAVCVCVKLCGNWPCSDSKSCIYLLRYRYIKNWKEVLQPLNPFMSLYVPAVKLLLC